MQLASPHPSFSPRRNPALLHALADRIRAIESRSASHDNPVSTVPAECSSPLEVLPRARGVVHEFFGIADPRDPLDPSGDIATAEANPSLPCSANASAARSARSAWSPPLCLLVHLARAALERDPAPHSTSPGPNDAPYMAWIGRACWPYPRLLFTDSHTASPLFTRSIFIDPPDDAARLWAIDLALRVPAVGVVIADATRLTMAATRRLQLAAASSKALCLLARPPHELPTLSAAATRWLIRRALSPSSSPLSPPSIPRHLDTSTPFFTSPSTPRHLDTSTPFFTSPPIPRHLDTSTPFFRPCWTVELLRHKGLWPNHAPRDQDVPHAVTLEWDHETGTCVVPAHLVREPHPTTRTSDTRPSSRLPARRTG